MDKLTVLLLSVLSYSCMAQLQKTMKFSTGRTEYLLDIPSDYKLENATDYHGFTEQRMLYPDSSIIYITDDSKSGGAINKAKAEKYGDGIYLKILSSDTLNISGVKNGNYWREQKMNDLVIGYINVAPDKKEQYDKALATIRRKE